MFKHFTDDNWQIEVIEASKHKPVLVDFFAAWCGPCKMQAPIVAQVAEELRDQAVVGSLDTEASPNMAMQYGVMSIPTLIIFRHGQVQKTFIGVQPKDILVKALTEQF